MFHFFVFLIIDDLGLFRLVSFVSFMTFYTFFSEEEGLLLVDHLCCTQFIVSDGLVSSSFTSLFFPEPPGPACHCRLLVCGLPLWEQARHRLAQLWLLHYGSGARPQPLPRSAGQVVRVWEDGTDTFPNL